MSFYENGVTGHRGDPQHFPQNTLIGFESAIKLGCDWVETDIHLTRDGRVVISHDPHTRTEADQMRIIRETDFSDLRKLNMATRFNIEHDDKPGIFAVMPSLEETLELFKSQDKVRLSLQPKAPGALEIAAKVIHSMNFPEEMLGFNDGTLQYMCDAKKLFPGSTIFYDILNIDTLEEKIAVSQKFGFKYIVANENFLDQASVNRILDSGLIPGVWNINNPGETDRFLAMGVKRFYTDYPAVLMKKIYSCR